MGGCFTIFAAAIPWRTVFSGLIPPRSPLVGGITLFPPTENQQVLSQVSNLTVWTHFPVRRKSFYLGSNYNQL
jgi:hypothetical protein